VLEGNCFYSSVPTEAVTISAYYASFHSLCCLMNRS